MKRPAAAARRNARASASGTATAKTPRKAKTAATQTKTRATTARTSARSSTSTRTATTARSKSPKVATTAQKKQATTASRRGQPVRSREVGGMPWADLRASLTSAFEAAFADRKGQARGAAMRGPNRIMADLDKYVAAITRQTTARQAQVQKLTAELAEIRGQQPAGTSQPKAEADQWPPTVTRVEHTAPDNIAGQRTETAAQQEGSETATGGQEPQSGRKQRNARHHEAPASAV